MKRNILIVILSLVIPGSLSFTVFAGSGYWSATGSPVNYWPSVNERGAALSDGRVVLASAGTWAKNTEIYNPSTGTWAAAEDMPRERSGGQTTVRLIDDRVLVAGGCQAIYCSGVNWVDIYNPAVDSWESAAGMNAVRWNPAAVTLPDGKVLVVGGSSAAGAYFPVIPQAEVYDPATDTWSATGPMVGIRTLVAATLLLDGKVLATGIGNSAEIYDPATDTWTATGNLHTGRFGHKSILLDDGSVLVAGGSGSGATSAEIYDPTTETWSITGDLNVARISGYTATKLASNRVLVTGGRDAMFKAIDSAEVFDPSTGAWEIVGSMTKPRIRHFAAGIAANGTVLTVGGAGIDAMRSAELFSE